MKSNRLPSIAMATFVAVIVCAAGCSRRRGDAQIAADVQAKIYADSNVPGRQITVQSSNGVVTLTGTVGSETERSAAANDAAQVEGVALALGPLPRS